MKPSLKFACGAGAVCLLMIGGCHTVEGAGRDVQAIGAGVERGAESTRHGAGYDPYYYDNRTRPLTPRRDW